MVERRGGDPLDAFPHPDSRKQPSKREPMEPDSGENGGRPLRRWRSRSTWLGLLGALAVIMLGAKLLTSWTLDRQIREVLEAPALASPSIVYSQPVRLFPGLPWNPEDVESAFQDLGYQRQRGAEIPGTYEVLGPILNVHLRPLRLPDRTRAPLRVTIRFHASRNSIAKLEGPEGEDLPEVETEAPKIGGFYGIRRIARDPVRLDEVPAILRDAVLLVEDRRFFEHAGLDFKGIARALTVDLRAGETLQGGSTITQQLAKNLFLTHERTWRRKAAEAVYALRIERISSKESILEAYLNQVFLGADRSLQISGVAEASRHYFGVDVRHVNLAQAALLAGLVRAPGKYDPFRKPEEAAARRGVVLDQLWTAGRITLAERDAAAAAPLELRRARPRVAPGSSAYLEGLRAQLSRHSPDTVVEEAGLRIYAPLDPAMQAAAQEALDDGLAEVEGRRGLPSGRLQGAIVVLEPQSGSVLALAGGRGGVPGTFNRALQAKRQPGSLMKPLVYAAALATGRFTAASLLEDEPLELPGRDGPWRPANADGRYRGPVTLRRALEYSLNVPSVRLFQEIGPRPAIDLARGAGIASPLGFDYSIVLGTSEVTPLEMAAAFAVFAAEGRAFPPRFAGAVLDPGGRALEGGRGGARQVLSPEVAFLVNQLLRGVCRRGTARSLNGLASRFPLAGKTGTTTGGRDAWFVGYTPRFLALVWVGPDDPEDLRLSGASTAVPIWRRLVESLPGVLQAPEPEPPPGVVKVRIDPRTGLLASRSCEEAADEWFLSGTEPRRFCNHTAAVGPRESGAAPSKGPGTAEEDPELPPND
jgi:penicillin-binding protein 1B